MKLKDDKEFKGTPGKWNHKEEHLIKISGITLHDIKDYMKWFALLYAQTSKVSPIAEAIENQIKKSKMFTRIASTVLAKSSEVMMTDYVTCDKEMIDKIVTEAREKGIDIIHELEKSSSAPIDEDEIRKRIMAI